ncbi:MAG TPA: hypothetical protein VMF69_13905 [Gemmataceae bacterium]|nr:hypothetical protein [Gemmataceae bacterium]
MAYSSPILELNRQLAMKINEEARRDPHSPYAHKFVGIINGQVAVIADGPEEVSRRLRELEPEPLKCFIVEASRDYNEVHEIWGVS